VVIEIAAPFSLNFLAFEFGILVPTSTVIEVLTSAALERYAFGILGETDLGALRVFALQLANGLLCAPADSLGHLLADAYWSGGDDPHGDRNGTCQGHGTIWTNYLRPIDAAKVGEERWRNRHDTTHYDCSPAYHLRPILCALGSPEFLR